jgi:hypothetical protein
MMTPRQIQLCLIAVEKVDPVAELAARIIDAGITEVELGEAIRGVVVSDPLKVELQNKYRDLARSGWTFNRHGKRWKLSK